MKKYLMPLPIPAIAIASYHLENESLATFAVFSYWFVSVFSVLCCLVPDFLKHIRREESNFDKLFICLMWAAHLYVLYIGFAYTFIMLVVASFILTAVKNSDFQGIKHQTPPRFYR